MIGSAVDACCSLAKARLRVVAVVVVVWWALLASSACPFERANQDGVRRRIVRAVTVASQSRGALAGAPLGDDEQSFEQAAGG